MKILVVDDDHDQRQLRSQLLARHDFEALQAADAKTAKALLLEHRPAVVLLDLSLPTLDDGVEGMTFITAAVKSSAEDGRWVKFSEV